MLGKNDGIELLENWGHVFESYLGAWFGCFLAYLLDALSCADRELQTRQTWPKESYQMF
jgi:hypothetical protein